MFNWRDACRTAGKPWCAVAALLLVAASSAVWAQAGPYPGIGRAATPKEVQAWDIDVRPDFKGLPKGSGSVAKGMEVWESKCASCHGVFGESNQVFTPVVGGTTKGDVKTGRVAALTDPSYPGRTTMMKLSSVSTLWDYINRAMPWTQPKSLTTEEVYAVTAYILNLSNVVPDNFVLSDQNIQQVQDMLPNRNGKTLNHGLWPGRSLGKQGAIGQADVKAVACMKNCPSNTRVVSELPEHARDAHGNLAEQNRLVGAQRGADTTRPAAGGVMLAATSAQTLDGSNRNAVSRDAAAASVPAASAAAPAASSSDKAAIALAQKHTCTACHGMDNKLVGPSFQAIAKKHAGKPDAQAYLADKIKAGGQGVWGSIPMPAQSLPASDAAAIAAWLVQGAKR